MSRGPTPGAPGPAGSAQSSWFNRFLNVVEWLGNALPHPVTLFALLAVFIVFLSGFLRNTALRELAFGFGTLASDVCGGLILDDGHL